MKNSIKVTN